MGRELLGQELLVAGGQSGEGVEEAARAWMTHAGPPMPAAIRAYSGGRVICDLGA